MPIRVGYKKNRFATDATDSDLRLSVQMLRVFKKKRKEKRRKVKLRELQTACTCASARPRWRPYRRAINAPRFNERRQLARMPSSSSQMSRNGVPPIPTFNF